MQIVGLIKGNTNEVDALNMPQQIHEEVRHEALVGTIYEDTEEDMTRGENDYPRSV